MLSTLYKSIVTTALFVLILCGAYPLAVTGIAKLVFKNKADGSLIIRQNKIVGSELIGQNFSDPKYFHGRPSAAGQGYDAANSSGSNLGPTSQKLADRLNEDIQKILKENPGIQSNQIPIDLVTTSASGLDPHISPETAYLQADRIAQVRNIPLEKVRELVQSHIEKPQWGLFGESRINVLLLNLDLDRLQS